MNQPVISIIEDDEATRASLTALLRASGFAAQAYESAEAFLSARGYEGSHCIITDIQMPGLSGIDLKRQLDAGRCVVPVIMITARGRSALAQARAGEWRLLPAAQAFQGK